MLATLLEFEEEEPMAGILALNCYKIVKVATSDRYFRISLLSILFQPAPISEQL